LAALAFSIGSLQGQPAAAPAQDQPAPIPRFLPGFYIGVQLGYIDYSFSNAQLLPGFHAQAVQTPHLAARVFLVGHEFNKYFSVQISDMRPVVWVTYQDVNGDQAHHYVWMNIGGLTARPRWPITGKLSVYGEGGLGLVARKGFGIGGSQVVNDASYATLLFGGGLDYRVNDHWSLLTGVTAAPGRSADTQPRTLFFSGGFNYALRRLPAEQVAADSANGRIWPRNIIQIGYATNALGYGVNNFVSKGAVPVFWSGLVQAASGESLNYQRHVLHTRRFFSFDWGAGVSSWQSRINGERFYTASLYPVFRFTAIRTRPLEFYLSYSLAGPTWITRTAIDGQDTGRHFTFQDFMGAGVLLGRSRRIAADIRIVHYSNGNLFPQNAGVTIPPGFYIGSTF
jgi:opacity protein-like surface antigen